MSELFTRSFVGGKGQQLNRLVILGCITARFSRLCLESLNYFGVCVIASLNSTVPHTGRDLPLFVFYAKARV